MKRKCFALMLTTLTLTIMSCNLIKGKPQATQPAAESSIQRSPTTPIELETQPAVPTVKPSDSLSKTRDSDPLVQNRLPGIPIPVDALVIGNGTLIDGTGTDPIPGGAVVIQGNHILTAGRLADFAIPPKTEVIDVAGKTIMPGIINSHVHNASSPAIRHRFLVSGVTTVCDLGGPLDHMAEFRQEYTAQNQPTARGIKAGPIITVPGGYPGTFPGFSWDYEVTTPTEAQDAVVDLIGQDADVIKVAIELGLPQNPWPVLTIEQLQAIVSTAHAHNLLVRAHLRQAAMLDTALAGGVDVIDHIPIPFCLEAEYKEMLEEDALHLTNFPEFEAQLARMVEEKIILVPTLAVNTCIIENLPGLEADEQHCMCGFLGEILHRFRELGGVVALGNDYGNPGVQIGMPFREMELLKAAGFTPIEIIQAGTQHAAQVCGHSDELGTLEPGKLADLIVVDGNPLLDIKAMNRVIMVVKDGEIVYAPEGL